MLPTPFDHPRNVLYIQLVAFVLHQQFTGVALRKQSPGGACHTFDLDYSIVPLPCLSDVRQLPVPPAGCE